MLQKKKKTHSFLPATLKTQKSNKNNNNNSTDNYNNKNSKKKNGNPNWSQEGLFCFCCSLVVIVF